MPREANPSQEWDEQGRLVRRGIASDVAGDPQEVEAVTGREPDQPSANSTFAERAAQRREPGQAQPDDAKRVEGAQAEDKAVESERAQRKGRRR